MKDYYVYIMANQYHSVLYIGFTNDLSRRVYEHKQGLCENAFTKKYHTDKLVYYEVTSDAETGIEREKQLKKWSREKKEKLIERQNPAWDDLYQPE